MAISKDELRTVITAQDKATATLKKVKSQTDVTTEGFSKLGALFTTGAIAVGFNKFGSLAEIQAQALSRLQTAVKNTGEDYLGLEEDVLAVTSALQKKTTFGDEAQIAALAELTTVTGSYETALASLPLVLDVAAQKGIDLTAAAKLLGRGISGDVTVFSRFGNEIKTLIEQEAGLDKILGAVQKAVKGQAQALGNVSPLTQFKNNIGDIGEEIGKKVLPVIGILNSGVEKLGTTFVTQQVGALLFAAALPKIVAGVKSLTLSLKAANIASKSNIFTLIASSAILAVPAILKARDAQKKSRIELEKSGEFFKTKFANDKKLLELAKEKQKELDKEEAKIKATEDAEKRKTKTIEEGLKMQAEVRRFAVEQEQQANELRNKNIIDEISNRFEKERELTEQQFDFLSEKAKENQEVIDLLNDDRLQRLKEIDQEEIEFKKDRNSQLLQLQIDAGLISLDQQREILELRLEEERRGIELEKELDGEASIGKLIREQELQNSLIQINKDSEQIKRDEIARTTAIAQRSSGALLGGIVAIAAVNKNASRENFAIFQGTAIAQASVGASLAIIKTLAELGPIAGPIVSVGIALKTAAEIANIIKQKPSFQTEPGEFRRIPGPENLPIPAIVHGQEIIGRPLPAAMGNINITIQGDVLNGEETMGKIQEGLVELELLTGRKAVV